MQRVFEFTTDRIREYAELLRAGDRVVLTGTVYTSRDQAHLALMRLLDSGEPLPFELRDAIIYYAGPTPGHDGMAAGACGPTTSSRMDGFTPRLLDLGLAAMIGKGLRSDAVKESIIKNGAVYLCAVGGAGALIAKHITEMEEIAFPELGCESIKRLRVESLPLTVGVDCHGGDIFKEGIRRFSL